MKTKLISIGNDIVALNQTNSYRTLQKRFYSKILSADEVSFFNNSNFQLSFENFIWLSWSIKESVFKFVKRHHHKAEFASRKIRVKTIIEPQQQAEINSEIGEGISFYNAECFCCEVLYNNEIFYTRSLANHNFIFTVANNSDNFANIFWGIKNIESDSYNLQTKLVRKFVLERLQQHFEKDHLQIEKSAVGFPFIIPYNHIPLSFTHHGNFVGYSFVFQS